MAAESSTKSAPCSGRGLYVFVLKQLGLPLTHARLTGSVGGTRPSHLSIRPTTYGFTVSSGSRLQYRGFVQEPHEARPLCASRAVVRLNWGPGRGARARRRKRTARWRRRHPLCQVASGPDVRHDEGRRIRARARSPSSGVPLKRVQWVDRGVAPVPATARIPPRSTRTRRTSGSQAARPAWCGRFGGTMRLGRYECELARTRSRAHSRTVARLRVTSPLLRVQLPLRRKSWRTRACASRGRLRW